LFKKRFVIFAAIGISLVAFLLLVSFIWLFSEKIGDSYYSSRNNLNNNINRSIFWYEVGYKFSGNNILLIKLCTSIDSGSDYKKMIRYYSTLDDKQDIKIPPLDLAKYQGEYIAAFYFEYGFDQYKSLFEQRMSEGNTPMISVYALTSVVYHSDLKPIECEWIISKCTALIEQENIDLMAKAGALRILVDVYKLTNNIDKANKYEMEIQKVLGRIEEDGLSGR
jgi:hypothetical protein